MFSVAYVNVIVWRRNEKRATYQHVWWDCRKITVFWRPISMEVGKIIENQIPFILWVYLLHDFSRLEINRSSKILLLNLCCSVIMIIDY